jgi:carboxypeptidase Q
MIPRLTLACAALLACSALHAQNAATQKAVPQFAAHVPSNGDLVGRMIDEGLNHSHTAADLEYLTDVIGPRLSGSPEMQRATEWTQQKFREYGMDRTALEGWTFGVGWTRGPMTLRMLSPQRRELQGVSWAWSPGTNGPLAGDVVFMDARTETEFNTRFRGKLRGAWVMMGLPVVVESPSAPPVTHADSARLDSLRRVAQPHNSDEQWFFTNRTALVARENPAGLVRDGGKQFGLFTMSGSPAAISSLPQIVVGNDTYSQFERLSHRGEKVRIESDIKNTFGNEKLEQYNTIGEIRGSEHPDQVVIVGGHLDSWDLATGATDNGSGAISVLEAARILKASGVRPKRTIRFILFGGEEEGLFGSQAYAAAHAGEADNVQAVLVLDNGTGRITGMALQGHEELRDLWKSMLTSVSSLGTLVVRSGNKTGTDHLSFIQDGIPSFNYDQLKRGYDWTHHSQIDDYDYAVPGDIDQAATIMAVNAWELADVPELLPRGPKR